MSETNMIELLKVADVTSRQSDRWLFMASLLLLGLFAWAVIRWLVKVVHRLTDQMKDITMQQMQINSDLRVSLDRNTEALRINNYHLEKQNRKES